MTWPPEGALPRELVLQAADYALMTLELSDLLGTYLHMTVPEPVSWELVEPASPTRSRPRGRWIALHAVFAGTMYGPDLLVDSVAEAFAAEGWEIVERRQTARDGRYAALTLAGFTMKVIHHADPERVPFSEPNISISVISPVVEPTDAELAATIPPDEIWRL